MHRFDDYGAGREQAAGKKNPRRRRHVHARHRWSRERQRSVLCRAAKNPSVRTASFARGWYGKKNRLPTDSFLVFQVVLNRGLFELTVLALCVDKDIRRKQDAFGLRFNLNCLRFDTGKHVAADGVVAGS